MTNYGADSFLTSENARDVRNFESYIVPYSFSSYTSGSGSGKHLDALYDRSYGTLLTLTEHDLCIVPSEVDVFLNLISGGGFLAGDHSSDHPAYRDNLPPRSVAAFDERTNRTQSLVRTRSDEDKIDIPILDAARGDKTRIYSDGHRC